MIWQRIDENTYIDDTLVTCAEYQLFIDEMREQGKYYQPDHWTSYQYIKGEAREPIIGTRSSDAISFCEWLTKQNNANGKYRMPTNEEGMSYPLESSLQKSLGYWIRNAGSMVELLWIDPAPEDARKIAFDRDRALELPIFGAWSHVRKFTRLLDTEPGFERTLNSAIADACVRALDLSSITGVDLNFIYNRATATFRSKQIAREFGKLLDLILDRTVERNFAFNLLVDILTLQERIAGRSPAFEGIRLVKYREE